MRNHDYSAVLHDLVSQIEKGRIGVCGELSMSLSVKGNEHEYNRCIRSLNRTFSEAKEKYKVSACADLKGKVLTTFTSSKFSLEVVNV